MNRNTQNLAMVPSAWTPGAQRPRPLGPPCPGGAARAGPRSACVAGLMIARA